MVAYSFKKRFVLPILTGTKPGTIRAIRKRHAEPGEQLQLYQGMRTRQCRLIMRAPCTETWSISIKLGSRPEIIRGPDKVDDLDRFAVADGFTDFDDMARFWHDEHPDLSTFSGVQLMWDPGRAFDRMAP